MFIPRAGNFKGEKPNFEAAQYRSTLSWLDPYSFEKLSETRDLKFIDGTCTWIMQENQFKEWRPKESVP